MTTGSAHGRAGRSLHTREIRPPVRGTNRVQQLYVNGAQLINAANYPAASLAFRFFKFGFMQLSGPDRLMWYDDVAVAPTRVGGCP